MKNIPRLLLDCSAVNDQIIWIRLHGYPFNMMMIHVYVPMNDATEDVDQFYDHIQFEINRTCKTRCAACDWRLECRSLKYQGRKCRLYDLRNHKKAREYLTIFPTPVISS